MITDRFLINGLQKENKAIIDKIFEKYHRRIYLFAQSYLKLGDDSADIVQEVFLKLWKSRHQLKEDSNLDAFVFTIARNSIISIFRKRSSENKYMAFMEKIAITTDNDTEASLDYHFLGEQVDHIINRLPQRRREVFLLSRKKGLSYKEIADELGISQKTVEEHISKALVFLRKEIDAAGILTMLFFFIHYYM